MIYIGNASGLGITPLQGFGICEYANHGASPHVNILRSFRAQKEMSKHRIHK